MMGNAPVPAICGYGYKYDPMEIRKEVE